MKKFFPIVVLVVFAATLASCTKTEQQSNLDIERSDSVTTVATVEAVDMETRMVKLRSFEGRPFMIHAGQEAVNLPQVRVGDKVEITYAQSLVVRMAEPGEVRNDDSTLIGRAEPGSKPEAFGVTETHVTARILDLDKASETATLEMADGAVATVKVQNPANLDKVKVGDTIAITYLEALEISVKE